MNAALLTPATLQATRAFAARVAKAYPTQESILFGSRARGTAHEESDADVAVILEDGTTVHNAFPEQEVHTMKISYDKATDSLYIHLADRASLDSDEVKDGVVLDFDANGALVGIDVQHASQRADLSNLSLSKMSFGEMLAA